MYSFLSKNSFKSDTLYEGVEAITDTQYKSFINDVGDGFFFSNSLHFYGKSHIYSFHDLIFRNKQIRQLFDGVIDDNVTSFGEDLFCNQFVYYSKGIGLLNVESAEIEFIANSFKAFMKELEQSIDYYSGESLMLQWLQNNSINQNERLTPKTPFILGGDFEINNLYKSNFNQILEFNASLAKQIKDLPDGGTVKIEIN